MCLPVWETQFIQIVVRGALDIHVNVNTLMLHRMFRIGQRVPRLPEKPHFIREPERDSDVCAHGRKASSDQNVIFAEVLDHVICWMKGIHHHEIGL